MMVVTVLSSLDNKPAQYFLAPDQIVSIWPVREGSEPAKCVIQMTNGAFRSTDDPLALARTRARMLGHSGVVVPGSGVVHNENQKSKKD